MSDHTWILENLAAYLANGLDREERERFQQHLAECPTCAAELSAARGVDTTLTGLFAETRPNPTLEDRVVQALRHIPSHTFRLPIPTWFAIAAAALVLIGFTGAVASQILDTGTFALSSGWEHAAARMDSELAAREESKAENRSVEQLAEESYQRAMSDLKQREVASDTSGAVHFSPDGQKLALVAPPGAVHLWMDAPDERKPESPPPPPADAAGDVKMKDGSVRDVGGVAGFGGNATGIFYRTTKPANGSSGEIAIRGFAVTDGEKIPSLGFQPGKVFDTPAATKDKELGDGQSKGSGGGSDASKDSGKNGRTPTEEKLPAKQPESGKQAEKPAEQPGPRKIVIRTGEIEYEVQSFDAAVATIARLVKPIKGGFIATVNSDKLANGKVRGSVVVRVPPENLDALLLEIRTELGKSGELKNQRIGSQDITKQYTDSESELRAARAMEERLLQIIKSGKGEIKDLLAVEKELGTWRTRIEKIEGELRFFANQVALGTLTITLFEKEIAAAYGVIEREQVQMGIEVEDVDQAYQAAQKAVREAKGRITRAELKQPSQGQFSAQLEFEVAPEAAGALRDRLKQLGTVARFDISRQEETEGGAGKPSDGKIKRSDTRFHVHFYNLTDVPPRETVFVGLACVDVEAAMKTLLGRIEKEGGRVVSSNLIRAHAEQSQGELQFQVKTEKADALLEEAKKAGEVMALQVREITNAETTRKKRGFQIKLLSLEAAAARETEEIQLACVEVADSYRRLQEAVVKVKGRVRTAQLNEQDRRKVTATLDVEIRRADEDALRDALTKAGEVYTRKTSRAANAENVVDSKIRLTVTFLNRANIPPRETFVFGVEVADVDQTAAMLSGLAGKREGRTIEANVARERSGRVTGKLIYDVPMAEVQPLIEELKAAGTVRVQQTAKHPEVPDSPLALARLEITLSNKELIVPSDGGFGSNLHKGLSDSFLILSWSLRFLILGLCVLLPWALAVWAIYRLVVRIRRRSTPATN
jgi:anti-sigma factor RsiW